MISLNYKLLRLIKQSVTRNKGEGNDFSTLNDKINMRI